MYKEISSIQNQLVKDILQLQEKSRARKKSGLFVVEGKQEIQLALKGNYELTSLLFCDAIFHESELQDFNVEQVKISKISKIVYQKLARRDSTEGVIALFKTKEHSLETIIFQGDNPLILVAEAPEKPGNIGALLRTADAANLDAVLIANPKTDLYNPNIIRSSVGCLFTNQIAVGSTAEIRSFLKTHNVSIFCAALSALKSYVTVDYTKSSAIVVGTEATGLSDEWLENSTENIIIPMQGEIDSMNVSVSAGILIFEAKRQRNFK
ncbi:MAG: RNA methyltransferase [Flavobacteriaceae bacterium]|nr:RNA methyltransferase [Flavobacteriaceae bacterium]